MIDFSKYDDEKLRLYILAWGYFPQVRILNNEDNYEAAIKEAEKRGLKITQ